MRVVLVCESVRVMRISNLLSTMRTADGMQNDFYFKFLETNKYSRSYERRAVCSP